MRYALCVIPGAHASLIKDLGSRITNYSPMSITILDDRGQYITIPYPVKSVVFLVENAMNSMYAVGGADKISGVGSIWMPEKKEPFFQAIDHPAKLRHVLIVICACLTVLCHTIEWTILLFKRRTELNTQRGWSAQFSNLDFATMNAMSY